MRLSDFDYHLPQELIAVYPRTNREEARLLVLNRKENTIEHRIFRDIVEYLAPGDLLVLNDTKVLHCRLVGRRKTGGKVELLLLKHLGGLEFEALLKPGRLKMGEKIFFGSDAVSCSITDRDKAAFQAKSLDEIFALGKIPLPPYIKREPESLDNEYYQTVYAKHEGSVASPTAGLHFTEELLERIKSKGVSVARVTLHVGHATFKPVKAENIIEHKMGKEYFNVGLEAARLIENARQEQSRIFAVGTTSCRVLESYAAGLREGFTDLYIYPGYSFKSVDCLLTNFHLPKTTLFLLVCAFAGENLAKKAYQEAVAMGYRFYSYGDAMLVL